jgi:drug/metabolite transporter (DMT)-like permease
MRRLRVFPMLLGKLHYVLFLQAFAGNFLFSILLLYGLKLTSAAESGIILDTTPVVVIYGFSWILSPII